ncbi:MAG: DUF2849 domain-containing protein [Rhizobium sp.]|uniref:DUF2849 domain-containing protein n=1 Tax=Rhizobium sp. TaxID=391 RepID=UPI00389984D0
MTNSEKGQALTANRLGDGVVVFLTRAGEWSLSVDDAALAVETDAARALEARGRQAEAANTVTGAYLFDAERHEGRVRALHIRERIRTLGPTVRQDLGKQAAGAGGAFRAVHS